MAIEDSRYEAVASRDARFDGVFFFAVATTGIYCRPSCPAITPKRQNVTFHPTAAAAQRAGYRACRRCRPDAVPGSAEWNARADVVGRAMRLIGDGVVDREGVTGLAGRLGYSPRQVQRQLNAEVGAGPVALARAQRGHTARVLLQTTTLQAAEIAFAAGFASVRQFNDTIRAIYAATPSELRTARSGRAARFGPVTPEGGRAGIPLRLPHRGPYDALALFDHLAAHALTGVEEVTGERGARIYRRTLRLPGGPGIAEIAEAGGLPRTAGTPAAGTRTAGTRAAGARTTGTRTTGARTTGGAADRSRTVPADGGGRLECRLHLTDLRDLTTATQRLRRLLDLDADPYAVAERLSADPALAPLVAARPGLRVPGTPDPHELAVRALLGSYHPSGEARAEGNALIAAHGQPLGEPSGGLTHLFPAAGTLAAAGPGPAGAPPGRGAALHALTTALADGTLVLDAGADRDEAERRLLALPGITPGTAGHIRMRALGDPDVLLGDDPAVLAGMARAGAAVSGSARWEPWRSYATQHLRSAP
ncbi:AlkA N-terminal domain-containing protein [Streptomyces sp. CAU 1734]|uniref:DNA-3-methyladenine glycosylase 2 family protein n=1 Tax=Streptomyces sp. CAU 1734 TaxID=3140360 RepID=UPI0032615130